MLRVGVFVSGLGRGSNLQAIIDACAAGKIDAEVAAVIGTRTESPAMDRAREAGVPAVVVSPRKYEGDSDAYGTALMRQLERFDVQLICLAGFMLKLPPAVVDRYRDRILNVHPALLPFFGGQGMYGENVHQAVLESGMKVSGATVHLVDEQYDSGPIVVQDTVRIEEGDTPATLAARVLPVEHRLYVKAISLFAEGRIEVDGRKVRVKDAGQG
jgi:formyltetrahydrofolate-dependent phosphoribosylglycinamide formyltransferase